MRPFYPTRSGFRCLPVISDDLSAVETGGIALKLRIEEEITSYDEAGNSSFADGEDSKFDCEEKGIAVIEGFVYNASDEQIAWCGPWDCKSHEGIIKNVEAGTGISLQLFGKNEFGEKLYEGEEPDIIVLPGETTQVRPIFLKPIIPEECPLVLFSVNPATITMQVGEEKLLVAVAQDKNGNPLDVSGVQWSSAMPRVAGLLQDTGELTTVVGVSEGGPVVVTATYDDGCQSIPAKAQVSVLPGLLTVEITMPADTCFAKGETLKMETRINDPLGNDRPWQGPIHWRSLNDEKATVDRDGLVTAKEEGAVTIEASYEENGMVYTGLVSFQILGLSGLWDVTEVADERDCDEGVNTYKRTVEVEHTGDTVFFQWPGGWGSGIKNGCTIGGYGGEVEDEDEGYTYWDGSLNILPDGKTITGSVLWDWNGTDPETGAHISCSGISDITARR